MEFEPILIFGEKLYWFRKVQNSCIPERLCKKSVWFNTDESFDYYKRYGNKVQKIKVYEFKLISFTEQTNEMNHPEYTW